MDCHDPLAPSTLRRHVLKFISEHDLADRLYSRGGSRVQTPAQEAEKERAWKMLAEEFAGRRTEKQLRDLVANMKRKARMEISRAGFLPNATKVLSEEVAWVSVLFDLDTTQPSPIADHSLTSTDSPSPSPPQLGLLGQQLNGGGDVGERSTTPVVGKREPRHATQTVELAAAAMRKRKLDHVLCQRDDGSGGDMMTRSPSSAEHRQLTTTMMEYYRAKTTFLQAQEAYYRKKSKLVSMQMNAIAKVQIPTMTQPAMTVAPPTVATAPPTWTFGPMGLVQQQQPQPAEATPVVTAATEADPATNSK